MTAGAVEALGAQVDAVLDALDPAALSARGRIDALAELQALRCRIDAAEQVVLAQIRARDLSVKQWTREEVACALRLAPVTAEHRLHIAEVLTRDLPRLFAAVRRGSASLPHARAAVDALPAGAAPEVVSAIDAYVSVRADGSTVGEFRQIVRRAVARFDPAGAEQRHEGALAQRGVGLRAEDDAMATLAAFVPAPQAQAAFDRLTRLAAARARHDPGGLTVDQARADLLLDLVLGTPTDTRDGAASGSGVRPRISITLDAATLAGLNDHPAHLDGHGPIPAALARTIADDPTGTWRRVLVDPAGRVVDCSPDHRPPSALDDAVRTRDQTCRFPGCRRRAARCDLDHYVPWPAGPTSLDNLWALCPRHHHLKHEAGWTITRLPDGTTDWTSPTGHRYTKPPPRPPTVD